MLVPEPETRSVDEERRRFVTWMPPAKLEEALVTTPLVNVWVDVNVCASSRLASDLSATSASSSENASSDVEEILLLNFVKSPAARQPAVEPLALSQSSVLLVTVRPLPAILLRVSVPSVIVE